MTATIDPNAVPIKQVAQEELHLRTHEIDTFTGWTPPVSINLIIAVSFGLFVPSRLLNGAKYGGLNVHPSLLPDLSGPAPIHHTLLKQRSKTGITIQNLHPQHFDRGMVIAQTPAPGLSVPACATPSDLIASLGVYGGEMLVESLKSHAFVPPLEDAGWYGISSGPIEHARKISKIDSYVDFSTATAQDILVRHRVLGDLWCVPPPMPNVERIILNEIESIDVANTMGRKPGLFIPDGSSVVAIQTVDGKFLRVKSCTVSGGKKQHGNAQLIRLLT